MKSQLNLSGSGAWYCRVSDEKQELETQRTLILSFLKKNQLAISPLHRFEDLGLARDMSDLRPDFQRMIRAVEDGLIKWIVITATDRFGTKDEWELAAYIYRLREAGCNLYLIDGTCLTDGSFATFVQAGVAGAQSTKEQKDKAERSLKGGRAGVANGEWQGGAIPYGLDVACLDSTGTEVWRVVVQTKGAKLKLSKSGESKAYPADRFPKKDDNEILQLRPTIRVERLEVVRRIFNFYTTQVISCPALARHLNELQVPHTYADVWAHHHVRDMVRNTVYIGKQRYGYSGAGRHLEWDEDGTGFRPVEKVKRFDKKTGTKVWRRASHRRPEKAIFHSKQLFEPIIDKEVWEAAQKKIRSEHVKHRAPRTECLWLTGLLFCAGCGNRMRGVLGGHTPQYVCGTYADKRRYTRMGQPCTCGRNTLHIGVVESTIKQWLTDTGSQLAAFQTVQRTGDLSLLRPFAERHVEAVNRAVASHQKVVERISENELGLDQQFKLAMPRFNSDLANESLIEVYREVFNLQEFSLREKYDAMDFEIAKLTESWLDLPTPRAKKHAKERLEALEAEFETLRARLQNAADEYVKAAHDVNSMASAFESASQALNSNSPDRQKGEAVRQVVGRINATFKDGMVELEIIPVDGETRRYRQHPKGAAPGRCSNRPRSKRV